mmetsp:Transcript_11727/g.26170  ORF Transcript_11727/g.26170 Transcript_11727/m.26170 type:complete len:113 (+) Transcript_11727:765-1103(+)
MASNCSKHSVLRSCGNRLVAARRPLRAIEALCGSIFCRRLCGVTTAVAAGLEVNASGDAQPWSAGKLLDFTTGRATTRGAPPYASGSQQCCNAAASSAEPHGLFLGISTPGW